MQHRIIHVQYKNEFNAGVVTYGKNGNEEATRTLILEKVNIASIPEAVPDLYARVVYKDGHYEVAELYQVPEVGFQSPKGDGVVEEFVNIIVAQRNQT